MRKLIRTLIHIGDSTGFEQYLRGVQRGRGAGTPTRDEARRDFQAMHWRR